MDPRLVTTYISVRHYTGVPFQSSHVIRTYFASRRASYDGHKPSPGGGCFLNGTPNPFSAKRIAHFETSSLTWDVWVSQGPPRPFMKSVL